MKTLGRFRKANVLNGESLETHRKVQRHQQAVEKTTGTKEMKLHKAKPPISLIPALSNALWLQCKHMERIFTCKKFLAIFGNFCNLTIGSVYCSLKQNMEYEQDKRQCRDFIYDSAEWQQCV
jgi:hypothetical protein